MDHVPIDLGDLNAVKLHSRGPWPLPAGQRVAVVGTRRPTPYGETVAWRLAQDLARHGVLIVGGLSRGVEAVVHQAALEADGRSVAVLGTGVDVISRLPTRNSPSASSAPAAPW